MLLLTKGLHQLCSETTQFLPKCLTNTLSPAGKYSGFPVLISDPIFFFFGDLEDGNSIVIKFIGAGGQIS